MLSKRFKLQMIIRTFATREFPKRINRRFIVFFREKDPRFFVVNKIWPGISGELKLIEGLRVVSAHHMVEVDFALSTSKVLHAEKR